MQNGEGDKLPFATVCRALDQIKSISGSKHLKQKIIKDLFQKFGRNKETALTLLRLLDPEDDRERRGCFNLRDQKLAHLLGKALHLSQEDLQSMKRFNAPQHGVVAGDFAAVATSIIGSRGLFEGKGASVGQVDGWLKSLVAMSRHSGSKDPRHEIIVQAVAFLSQSQMAWFLRIILGQLKMGASEKTVLEAFHPDAPEMMKKTDLKAVAELLYNLEVKLGECNIKFGQPFDVQLAQRWEDKLITDVKKGRYVFEPKYDGERLSVHLSNSDEFLESFYCFSRKRTDYSKTYQSLRDPLLLSFSGARRNVILDGEVMAWNCSAHAFEPFGSVKTAAAGNDPNLHLIFAIFDVVMLDDKPLTSLPWQERRTLLEEVVKPVENKIFLSPVKILKSEENFIKACNDAFYNNEEGIVLKHVNSTYKPGNRDSAWVKWKPDYVTATDDWDLIIIGARLCKSFARAGHYWDFTLGILERNAPSGILEVHSFTNVGTGLKWSELQAVEDQLSQYFLDAPPANVRVLGSTGDTCDKYIAPENSIVLQIRADHRMIASNTFATKLSLRFPRIVHIREKPWTEASDTAAIILRKASMEGLGGRQPIQNVHVIEKSKAKRKAKEPASVLPIVSSVAIPGSSEIGDKSQTSRQKQLFTKHVHGTLSVQVAESSAALLFETSNPSQPDLLKFCLIHGAESTEKDRLLVSLIERNGGKLVPSINDPRTTLVIVSDMQNPRVSRMQQTGKFEYFLKPQWIHFCIDQGQVVVPPPICYTAWHSEKFRLASLSDCDQFGDSYTKLLAGEAELGQMLELMSPQESFPVNKVLDQHPETSHLLQEFQTFNDMYEFTLLPELQQHSTDFQVRKQVMRDALVDGLILDHDTNLSSLERSYAICEARSRGASCIQEWDKIGIANSGALYVYLLSGCKCPNYTKVFRGDAPEAELDPYNGRSPSCTLLARIQPDLEGQFENHSISRERVYFVHSRGVCRSSGPENWNSFDELRLLSRKNPIATPNQASSSY